MTSLQQFLKNSPIRWDAHGCPPFKIGSDLSFLKRYKQAGVNYISMNIGFDLTTQNMALELINYFKQWINKYQDEFGVPSNIQQLIEYQNKDKLSIAFDIEGASILNGKLDMVATFYSLGVKQIAFSYNNNNAAGGGCFDITDIGLTHFGKHLVKECNDVGMVIDCSHAGYKTSLDIINLSKHPVVFSHSNPATLINHPRNIIDEQIIACANKGGVIGINGIGIFLGNNDVRTERIVEHIDYIAQMVGPKHVGVGLDCVFAEDEAFEFIKNSPETFPPEHGFNDVAVAQPEQFAEIHELLLARAYSENDINNILGENFLRVAHQVWK